MFVVLVGASALLGVWFVGHLGLPWRSRLASMAWLQSVLAAAAVAFDVLLLLAILRVHVPQWVAVLVVLAQDAAFGWRLAWLYRARRQDTVSSKGE